MNKINFRIQRQDNLNEIVVEDVAGPGNGRHHYQVFRKDAIDSVASPLLDIQFQCGARNEKSSTSGVLDQERYKTAKKKAIEWNAKYIEYSKENGRAYYPSRTRIL